MRAELQAALCADFPEVCGSWGGDPRQTCMAFGFDVGDGWEPILRRMMARLSQLPHAPQLTQVKEKWGILRVYISPHTDEAQAIVDRAEADSKTVCEDCGKPGRLREGGWLRTLCDDCKRTR